MYLMVIASSTYASVGLKFKSIQPSTVTVGTIAELSGEHTVSVSMIDTSVANVGTVSTCEVVVTSMFTSNDTDDSVVGTIGAISVAHTTLFASNDAVRSDMTIDEPAAPPGPPPGPGPTPGPTLDSLYGNVVLLLNGEV